MDETAWKETVRVIFDNAHFHPEQITAEKIIRLIEARHREYFCGTEMLKE